MTHLRQDIRYGIRTMLDRPIFTLVAALSLALGIGVNSTIFSIVNATLLAPLGFDDEDRIVAVTTHPLDAPGNRGSSAYREYEFWQQAQSFEAIGAALTGPKILGAESDGEPAEQLLTLRTSPGFYDVIGIRPQIGRLITADEDRVDNFAPVVLISDRLWERRFARDPGVLGQTIRLDGVVTTIIGVMPPGVEQKLFVPNADLWAPSEIVTAQSISEGRFLAVFARLRPETTLGQARLELETMASQFAEQHPNTNSNTGFGVMSMHEFFYGGAKEPLLILQGAVLFVLLIACANVAGLLLARAASRQTEIAIRSALGAIRGRLIRQVMTECVVLSTLGGIFGVLLAWAGLRVFVAFAPPGIPNLESMSINLNVLAFTAIVVFLTAFLFGIAPAWQGTRPDLTTLLNDSARGSSSGRSRQRLRLAMVAGQTGIAMVLLITAGLMINSFVKLQGNDLGADTSGILTFRLQFSQDETITFTGEQVKGVGLWDVNPGVGQTIQSINEELNASPLIEAASPANVPPFQGAVTRTLLIDGRATDDDGMTPSGAYLAVMPGYFKALGMKALRGRPLLDSDRETSPPVVVINEAMANRYWPDRDPLGSYLTFDYVPGEPRREIVGVIPNVLLSAYDELATPTLYVPYVQQTNQWLGPEWGLRAGVSFVVKGPGDPQELVPIVRSAVARVDRDRPLTDILTIDQYLTRQTQDDALFVALLTIFGAIAGALAVTGIFGVISYTVADRTHEIGIRMALGSSNGKIMGLIMRQAFFVIVAGLAIGVVGAVILTRLIAGTLFGITATDPITFVAVSGLLLVTALAACFAPARRALKVDPSEVLRHE